LFLLCFSVVPLLCVFALSLTRRVMPNWPAPFYGTGLVFTAAWLLGWVDFGAMPRPLRPLFPSTDLVLRRSVWSGIACVGLTCLSPWAVHWLGVAGSKLDPTVRLRGWSDLAGQVARSRASALRPEKTFVLAATGRQEAGELAFYLPGQPLVSLWNPSGSINSQYDLWPGPVDKVGWDAVVVSGPESRIDPGLAQQFERIEQCRAAADVSLGCGRSRRYTLWLGRNFQSTNHEIPDHAAAAMARGASSASAH
jgi:hypothetical protein